MTNQFGAGHPPHAALVDAYLSSLANGRITSWSCRRCARARIPVLTSCPWCGERSAPEVHASSGTGTVWSFCTFHKSYLADFDPPYVVAVIELNNGVRLISALSLASPGDIYIGMPVRARETNPSDPRLIFVPTKRKD